LLIIRRLQ